MTSNQDSKRAVSGSDVDVTTIDWRDYEHPSTPIVEAVVGVTGQPPTELPPLQQSVDADALDSLFVESADQSVEVAFEYAGVNVCVTSDEVEVWR